MIDDEHTISTFKDSKLTWTQRMFLKVKSMIQGTSSPSVTKQYTKKSSIQIFLGIWAKYAMTTNSQQKLYSTLA